MCLNEFDNIVVHFVMRIMTSNRAKINTKCPNNIFQLFLSIISWKTVTARTQ